MPIACLTLLSIKDRSVGIEVSFYPLVEFYNPIDDIVIVLLSPVFPRILYKDPRTLLV